MKKRMIACGLALMLFLSLAACEKKTAKPDQKDTAKTSQEGGGQEEEAKDEWAWPLAEQEELSIWTYFANTMAQDPNELKGVQEIEKNTNVHVNWILSDDSEKFGLMLASGEYPDVIRNFAGSYVGGLVQGEQDGVIRDLTEDIPRYMPSYQSLLDTYEVFQKDSTTDDGRLLALYEISTENGVVKGEPSWGGLVVRRDWLNEVGLEVPETIEEWHTALTAFKEKLGHGGALYVGPYCYSVYGDFLTAYGVTSAFYKDNETVKYGPIEEGYRQFLTTMHQWYTEGLIDPDFVSGAAWEAMQLPAEKIATGQVGVCTELYYSTATTFKDQGYTEEEDFYLQAGPIPVLTKGDTPQLQFEMSSITKDNFAVSTAVDDSRIELVLRYMDYWYTEEACFLSSLGIEGESYLDNGDGTYSAGPALYELVENGTYPTLLSALNSAYSMASAGFGYYNYAFTVPTYDNPSTLESYDIWDTKGHDRILPEKMTMTPEDAVTYSSRITDISTLVQENTQKFILGARDLSEFDAYVEDVKALNIEDLIQFQQAAYDRYKNR